MKNSSRVSDSNPCWNIIYTERKQVLSSRTSCVVGEDKKTEQNVWTVKDRKSWKFQDLEKESQDTLPEAGKIPKAEDSSGGPLLTELSKRVLESAHQSKEKQVRRAEVMRVLDLSES